ncbi:ABC transporter permease [Cohnella mopanensis]|uniref:ABC transporter permease n=1 Tax=Cohnella mopanensis TaxID=2911966 RepID=UPI001EF98622|nr:ABC transporter permease [Cohnella mopanensis]
MLHLVRLELRKVKLGGIVRTSALTLLGVLGFVLLIGSDEAEGFKNYEEALTIIEMLVRIAFIIYASVLLSKLVVEEYRNQTMALLFTYPISRKKLLLAKLLIVGAITFAMVVIGTVLVSVGFYLFNEKLHYFAAPLTTDIVKTQAIHLVVNGIASAGMALVPLFFGMLRKSVPTTIVSSILIVALVNASNNGSSLGENIAVPITLGVIGFFVAYLSIRNVEHADL